MYRLNLLARFEWNVRQKMPMCIGPEPAKKHYSKGRDISKLCFNIFITNYAAQRNRSRYLKLVDKHALFACSKWSPHVYILERNSNFQRALTTQHLNLFSLSLSAWWISFRVKWDLVSLNRSFFCRQVRIAMSFMILFYQTSIWYLKLEIFTDVRRIAKFFFGLVTSELFGSESLKTVICWFLPLTFLPPFF